MSDNFFSQLQASDKSWRKITPTLEGLQFDSRGLIPVIAQCADSGRVLMLAWMNKDTIQETLRDGRMVYFSRSRDERWRKGDTSGNIQQLARLFADCDGDTLLALVRQTGPACHTGRPSCFYAQLFPNDEPIVDDE